MNVIEDYENDSEDSDSEEEKDDIINDFEVIDRKVYPEEVTSISNTPTPSILTLDNVVTCIKITAKVVNHVANYQRTGSIGCIRCGYSSHNILNCKARRDRYGNIL